MKNKILIYLFGIHLAFGLIFYSSCSSDDDMMEEEEQEGCNTENATYSGLVKPIIDNNCIGCHSGGQPSGGVNLSGYDNVKTYVDNGRLYGAISWSEGFQNMPQGGNKLDDCTLEGVKKWIDEGAPNN